MIIAFMGNDGSGKTTLAKKFVGKLIALGVNVQYRAEFDYFLLSHLFQLLGKEKVSRARKSFLIKEDRVWRHAYFKAWPYLVWADLLLEWIWNKLFQHSKVTVMDRCSYDFLMSWEWLGYGNSYIRWLYTHFPRPDLVFILDVSPTTAFQRKKTDNIHSLHYYKVQKKRYLDLAEILGIRIINTEKAVDECLEKVVTEFRRQFITKLSDEDNVLLFYSFPRFNPSIPRELNLSFDWSGLNWGYIVNMAVKCNTENVLCKNLLQYHRVQLPEPVYELLIHVLEKSNERVKLFVRTLGVVSRKLGEKKVPFVVMKTIAPFDYGATDIDILVRKEDFERARESLLHLFKASKGSRTHKAVTYLGTLLPVDLHHEVSWLGHKVVDEVKVFGRKKKVLYEGVKLFVPSREDELLILSAHSIFQHHYTTLGDFLRIVELASDNEIDGKYVLGSSGNYRWRRALQSFLSYLLWKHNFIYGSYYGFGEDFAVEKTYGLGISPICFHRFWNMPRGSPQQVMDLFLTIYRFLRFKLSGQLAYNTNWLRGRD